MTFDERVVLQGVDTALACTPSAQMARKVDVRLPGKGHSNSDDRVDSDQEVVNKKNCSLIRSEGYPRLRISGDNVTIYSPD